MAASNRSSDVNSDREDSGSTSRPPLPRPDNGDIVPPVPLWEREFCRNAYDIPWETFCKNKRFIELNRNVMNWDDSGALKNFEEAKERFRATYFGEGGSNNSNNNFHGCEPSNNWQQQEDPGHTPSGTGRMQMGGGTMWVSGAFTGGAMKWNGSGGNGTGRNWDVGGGGGGGNGNRNGDGSGSGRNRNGGNGGGGSSSKWNCFGRGNRRKQHEGQHQQRNRSGMQRNREEGQHQMSSGNRQQQGQGRMKTEWHPVQHNRSPKDDPMA